MKQSLDLFNSVSKPSSVQATDMHTYIASALYADDTLPMKRSSQNYSQHLQFIRFMLSIPSDGCYFSISREAGVSTLTGYIQSAINNGWLMQCYNVTDGKRMVKRSKKLDALVVAVSEVA